MAILMVLLSHGRHFLTPISPHAPLLRIGGFLGVELFFVLSGFLVGTIAWREFKGRPARIPWVRSFLIRRWLRTLPNYYLFLIVNVLLVAAAIVPGRVADLLSFLVFAQNLAWPHPPIFGEAWSLAVEEVFYLVLPLSLLVLGRIIPARRTALLAVTALLVLIPLSMRFLSVAFFDLAWDEGVRKVVLFRLDALMFGVLLGWLSYEKQLPASVRGVWLLVSGAAILSAAVWVFFSTSQDIDSSDFARVWLFPLVSAGFGLLVLSGLNWNKAPKWIVDSVESFARRSYAIYLAHMPVFHLIAWVFGQAPRGDVPGALARWVGFMLASIAIAALVERFFERPILLWRDRVIPR